MSLPDWIPDGWTRSVASAGWRRDAEDREILIHTSGVRLSRYEAECLSNRRCLESASTAATLFVDSVCEQQGPSPLLTAVDAWQLVRDELTPPVARKWLRQQMSIEVLQQDHPIHVPAILRIMGDWIERSTNADDSLCILATTNSSLMVWAGVSLASWLASKVGAPSVTVDRIERLRYWACSRGAAVDFAYRTKYPPLPHPVLELLSQLERIAQRDASIPWRVRRVVQCARIACRFWRIDEDAPGVFAQIQLRLRIDQWIRRELAAGVRSFAHLDHGTPF